MSKPTRHVSGQTLLTQGSVSSLHAFIHSLLTSSIHVPASFKPLTKQRLCPRLNGRLLFQLHPVSLGDVVLLTTRDEEATSQTAGRYTATDRVLTWTELFEWISLVLNNKTKQCWEHYWVQWLLPSHSEDISELRAGLKWQTTTQRHARRQICGTFDGVRGVPAPGSSTVHFLFQSCHFEDPQSVCEINEIWG